jgi:hypothetical protein
LSQKRKWVKRNIAENPAVIGVIRKSTISDGFGGTVIDPEGNETVHDVRVRIAHEKRSVPKDEVAGIGLSTNLSRMLLAEYNADILEGDVFMYENRYWRIGPIDTIMMFAGAVAKQAPLYEAENYADENT